MQPTTTSIKEKLHQTIECIDDAKKFGKLFIPYLEVKRMKQKNMN